MWKVRELADKVTNVVMNYTDIEAKVREATNDDGWGPTGTLKHELSQATFSYDQFPEVMGMLWKRIAENKRSPRRIYKSLLLLHHLLLNGSDRVIRATQDRIYELRSLTEYHVIYEPGFSLNSIIPPEVTKDGEMNVRVKAKEIVDLVADDERLRDDRKKAKKNRDKYVGIGSDRMMISRWGGSMGGSSEFDDMGEDIGRSKTPPPVSTPSPVLSKEPSTITVKKSPLFNHKSTPVVDLNNDDFNPREGEDFGDFKTASTSSATATTSGGVGAAAATNNDLFQADFNGAFGGSGNNSGINLIDGPQEIPEIPSLVTPSTASSAHSSSAITQSSLLFSNVIPPTSKPPQDNQVDLLGGLGSIESIVFDNAVQRENVIPEHVHLNASQLSTQMQQQHLQNFHNHHSILQPVIQSNQQSNNINNNHATVASNTQANSLKGTTWSDLNFDLNDLTINPSGRNQQTHKPTINQLKSIQNK